ncbi:MAG: NAD(P)-dependent alcohol dehydrogenase, partial [Dehalococcoidia bacterium]
VRIVGAGMCHTDLLSRDMPPEAFAGPRVFGHEGAGVVEAVGSGVSSVAPGDHVVLSFASCGTCPACRQNRRPYCFNFALHNMAGGRTDGSAALADANGERVGSHFFGQSSFASHALAVEDSVVPVDRSYDLAKLGPLGCGVQTGAGTVLNTLAVEEGSSLVVLGTGALGLSAVMAAKVAGAGTIIAVDRYQNRLDLATKYGATHTLSGDPAELAGKILGITGQGADYAFDTTGNPAVVRGGYEGLNNIGTLAMAGVGFGDVTFNAITMISGRSIRGVMEGDSVTREFIPRLAKLNAEGKFPFDELIVEFPLDRINEAEAASKSGEAVKPVLVPA